MGGLLAVALTGGTGLLAFLALTGNHTASNTDNSAEVAEYQRQLRLTPLVTLADNSHDRAESLRMQWLVAATPSEDGGYRQP